MQHAVSGHPIVNHLLLSWKTEVCHTGADNKLYRRKWSFAKGIHGISLGLKISHTDGKLNFANVIPSTCKWRLTISHIKGKLTKKTKSGFIGRGQWTTWSNEWMNIRDDLKRNSMGKCKCKFCNFFLVFHCLLICPKYLHCAWKRLKKIEKLRSTGKVLSRN